MMHQCYCLILYFHSDFSRFYYLFYSCCVINAPHAWISVCPHYYVICCVLSIKRNLCLPSVAFKDLSQYLFLKLVLWQEVSCPSTIWWWYPLWSQNNCDLSTNFLKCIAQVHISFKYTLPVHTHTFVWP